jgi:hypothetical protein
MDSCSLKECSGDMATHWKEVKELEKADSFMRVTHIVASVCSKKERRLFTVASSRCISERCTAVADPRKGL